MKLLEFGLDDPLAVHDRLTTAWYFLGTLPYMSRNSCSIAVTLIRHPMSIH